MLDAPLSREIPQDAPEAAPAAEATIVKSEAPCVWCGGEVLVRAKGPGQHKKFCSTPCRQAFANREKAQGAVLVTVAKAWRRARGAGGAGKNAFHEMTKILDLLIEDDRRTNVVDGSSLADRIGPYVQRILSGVDDYRESYLDRRVPRRGR